MMALDLKHDGSIAEMALKAAMILKAADFGTDRKYLINIHAAAIVTLIAIEAELCGHNPQELLQEVEIWLEETLGFLTKEVLPIVRTMR